MEAPMPMEENVDYEFDENVEDYSDDVDYEADEVEQEIEAHGNKKFKPDNTEKLLESGIHSSGKKRRSGKDDIKDDKKDVGVYASLLEAKYSDIKTKFEEAQREISELKKKKDAPPIMINPDERVKQLEDRVVLIKTKAKERIAEKDAIIEEQNEKLKKFEDILALLEVNCKQAVVKYNDAQVELAKKEEALQLHVSFKNRYDYKVNFLDEKCRKMQHDYENKIRKMEERFAAGGGSAKSLQSDDSKSVKEQPKKVKVVEAKDDGFSFPKKPKTLRIAKVESPSPAQTESKLPKVVKGLTIKEVLPSKEDANVDDKEESKVEKEGAKQVVPEKVSEKVLETVPESNSTSTEESQEAAKDESEQMVTNLPGVKITLTDAIDELDKLEFQEPSLE